MTGIERLRNLAGAWDEWGLGGTLAEMADQIERERAEDCYRMGLNYGTVWRVVADMERHCLGHEGMEDSPVARWARELREALKSDASDGRDAQNPSCADPDGAADVTSEAPKVTRDPAEDVSMSAYDLLPQEDREAIAWVREHGGLEHLKNSLSALELFAEGIEIDTGLAFSDESPKERCIALRNEVKSRLMPEGMEWPRFEDGEPVGFGDEVSRLGEVFSISLYRDGSFSLNFRAYSKGERVRRPAKVLDADGVEICVGDAVYALCDGTKHVVEGIEGRNIKAEGMTYLVADKITHCAPVLAADGLPLREREHVYHVETGAELVVKGLPKPGEYEAVVVFALPTSPASHLTSFDPDQLTHTKPERPVLDADGVPIRKGDTVYLLPGEWCDVFPCSGFHGGEELEVFADREASHVPGGVQCRETEKSLGFRGTCYPQPSQLTHTKPDPKRLCRDCRHWQGDPSASHMDVCFNSYRERCCVDSCAAQLDYAKACEDFEERGE